MDGANEMPLLPAHEDTEASISSRTIRKLDRRVLFMGAVVIFLAYIDRSNIGYAAKDLCNDLRLSHEEYGLGVSLFYVGYLTTQMLSNFVLKYIGAPTWLGFILFAWGIIAAFMGLMQTTTQFYILRVLLGIAEGGSFPALFYFLSLFYPPDRVTGACTLAYSAVSFSMPISSPISAGLITLGPAVNVEGWRLLLVVEGLVPVVYALVLYIFLPRDPESAPFLEPEEKDWIIAQTKTGSSDSERSFWEDIKLVVKNRPCWLLTATFFITFGISSVLMFWATLIIHDMLHGEDDDDDDSETCGSKNGHAALPIILTAIPYLLSGLACVWVRCSTIVNRSRFCAAVIAVGSLALISWVGTREVSFALGFVSLCFSIGSGYIVSGPVMALAMTFFEPTTGSTAAAFCHNLGGIGAVVFPPIVGRVLDDFDYGVAVPMCGACLMVAAVLVFLVKDPLVEKKTEIADSGIQ